MKNLMKFRLVCAAVAVCSPVCARAAESTFAQPGQLDTQWKGRFPTLNGLDTHVVLAQWNRKKIPTLLAWTAGKTSETVAQIARQLRGDYDLAPPLPGTIGTLFFPKSTPLCTIPKCSQQEFKSRLRVALEGGYVLTAQDTDGGFGFVAITPNRDLLPILEDQDPPKNSFRFGKIEFQQSHFTGMAVRDTKVESRSGTNPSSVFTLQKGIQEDLLKNEFFLVSQQDSKGVWEAIFKKKLSTMNIRLEPTGQNGSLISVNYTRPLLRNEIQDDELMMAQIPYLK